MPVRAQASASSPSPPPAPRKRGRLAVTIVIIAIVVIAAMVIGIVIGARIVAGNTPGAGATADPTKPPASPTPPDALPTIGGHPLPMIPVAAGSGGVTELEDTGMQVGYPQTMSGAVAAAINYETALNSAALLDDAKNDTIQNYIFNDPETRQELGVSDKALQELRENTGVNAKGQPVTESGKVDRSKKVYDAAYMEYGAVRLVSAQPDLKSNTPESARVQMWFPTVWGTGTPGSMAGVHVGWMWVDVTVSWVDGDWHVTAFELFGEDPPKPADVDDPITTFTERAKLLGTDEGWVLVKNAAEKPIPELNFPVDPER